MKKLAIGTIGIALIAIALSAAAPTPKRIKNITTTQGQNTFLPVGYNVLVCDGNVHYKMVTTSTATVATTDPMVKGTSKVPSNPVNISVSAGTQYLALLLDNGSPATCSVTQASTDGQTGSFTTLAVSSTAAITGNTTLGGTVQVTGDTSLGADAGVANNFNINGGLTLTSSSTALTAIKFGTITLGGQSPATGTATVLASMNCVCTPQTNASDGLTKCAVSSTTLTATGPNSSTGVISYLCFK